ncbi:hypothetical protein [Cecembia sp.]|uniref:hypothetical protein n=1 Tax=Cecembia sp. TaxID=1898110 RepID=UPI0025B9CAAC|nr:hypothetical protein [Cecembia sp.]
MNKDRLADLRERGYDFEIKDILERGLQMFLSQPLYSMAYTLLILTIQIIFASYFPNFTLLYAVFLAPPLFTGFYYVANKISLKQPVIYPDFFKGFSVALVVIPIWLVGQALTALGIFAFILPGVYLAVAYSFSVMMAIFGGFDFWTALEESRKLITVRWWKFFLFSLFLILINVLGVLFLFIGLIVTLPVTFYATYILFEDLTLDIFSE